MSGSVTNSQLSMVLKAGGTQMIAIYSWPKSFSLMNSFQSSSMRPTNKDHRTDCFSIFHFSCPALGGVANEQCVVYEAGSQRENEEKSVAGSVHIGSSASE